MSHNMTKLTKRECSETDNQPLLCQWRKLESFPAIVKICQTELLQIRRTDSCQTELFQIRRTFSAPFFFFSKMRMETSLLIIFVVYCLGSVAKCTNFWHIHHFKVSASLWSWKACVTKPKDRICHVMAQISRVKSINCK